MFKVPEESRMVRGMFATDRWDGRNGMFAFRNPFTRNGKPFIVAHVSDGEGWEHVSVSIEFRTPTWDEMCFVKSKFWDDEDLVIQIHPPKAEYVNNHKFCLHLWRRDGGFKNFPGSDLVGFVGVTHEQMQAACMEIFKKHEEAA